MAHVMVVCEFPSLNGAERSLLAVLPALVDAGIRVTVAGPPTGPLANTLRAADVTTVPYLVRDHNGVWLGQETLRRHLANLIGEQRPDLVHANSISMGRLSGPVCADLNVPAIAHLRDMINLSPTALDNLKRHNQLLAVSCATRQWYVERGLPARQITVVYNGIDLSRFAPRQASGFLHEALHLTRDSRLVGAVGQIGMRKGLDVVLAAAPAVLTAHQDVHFIIIGRRYSEKEEAVRYERQLWQKAAAGGLSGHIHFLGERHDVDRILNELTLLVHAARQEPLGRVLLEAAACGLPAVCTEAGGTGEIFPPGSESALLVPVDDPDYLAASVCQLLGDSVVRRTISRRARHQAETRFDAQLSSANLLVKYRNVLSNARGVPSTE